MNETDPLPNTPEIPKDFSGILNLIAKNPEMQRELITWGKKEFGFNIEPFIERYFGELPDKVHKIENIDIPIREIVEDLVGYVDEDGYSIGQAAKMLHISRSMASKLYADKDKFLRDIKKEIIEDLPFHKKIFSKILFKLGII